ncbi:hypothetical protein ACEQ8H_003336 [Pleosporales sp. CAS-2024a]
MFAPIAPIAPAMALLARAAVAQQQTPSVVTSISIPPVPTTEGAFTIQTSVPGFAESSACAVCVMQPCPPCGPTSEGSMGILPGETPIVSLPGEIRPSSLLSTSTATPASTLASGTSGAPQPSSAAAPPLPLQGHRTPVKLALAVSGLVLLGASYIRL